MKTLIVLSLLLLSNLAYADRFSDALNSSKNRRVEGQKQEPYRASGRLPQYTTGTVTQDLSAAQRYKESILGTAQFDAKMKHMKEHPEQYETKIAHPKHLSHKKFRGDDKTN